MLWHGDEGDPALRAPEGEGGERRLARGAGEAIPSRRRGGETEARAHTGRASAAGAEHRRREENPTVYTSLKVTAEKGTTVFGSRVATTAARACRLTGPDCQLCRSFWNDTVSDRNCLRASVWARL